jgi:acyl dehydratase
MLEVERAADLKAYEGKEIGVSDWYTVTQEQIDKFADATGDHQWIHVDVERAKPTGCASPAWWQPARGSGYA